MGMGEKKRNIECGGKRMMVWLVDDYSINTFYFALMSFRNTQWCSEWEMKEGSVEGEDCTADRCIVLR